MGFRSDHVALLISFALLLPMPTQSATTADADLDAAASALSTNLWSDDIVLNLNKKYVERQIAVKYSTIKDGRCALTIHREARTVYPHNGQQLIPLGVPTYYQIPLASMSTSLVASNGQYARHDYESLVGGPGGLSHREYAEDTLVPLVGLKTDVTPVEWTPAEFDPPSYPTYVTAVAAKAAISALAKVAASCAAPSPTAAPVESPASTPT